MNVDIAVGEVRWERELLAALAAHPDLDIRRRLVDLGTLDDAGIPLIASPAVRGFTEERVRTIAALRPLIIVVDSIRPPWLLSGGLPFHDLATSGFDEIVAACANVDPTPRLQLVQQTNRGRITAFAGISGGVGVSTLVCNYAAQHRDALVIDANLGQPSLAMSYGSDQRVDGYLAAIRELRKSGTVDLRATVLAGRTQVLAIPIDRDVRGELAESDLWRLLVAAAEQFDDVVIDAGILDGEALLDHVDHLVLVTSATPLGMVRLCARAGRLQAHVANLTIIVNRVRESAAGSRHVATAIRNLVRTELDLEPILIPDATEHCDQGWLAGSWDPDAMPDLRRIA